jgi:predicted lipid-binding transport protein (Tim44 family)
MSYCPKCGTKVSEEMVFCPKCGAPLKAEKPSAEARPTRYRSEKAEKTEKHEKQEKGEKTEKHEKQEFGFVGPLIGGLFLIFFGLMSYLQVTGFLGKEVVGALFLILIGIIIIVGVIYAVRRHPRP